MTQVWLIRHGASTAPAGLAIGATNPPLSELGMVQARSVAALLADRPLVRVVSSDMERALATASIVAAPHRLAVEPTNALREIDFGSWEGRSLGDLWSDEPAAARAWEGDLAMTPSSFGESVADLERRVTRFWERLHPLPVDGEIAMVAHRGSLLMLWAMIAGERLADSFAMRLEPGGVVGLTAG